MKNITIVILTLLLCCGCTVERPVSKDDSSNIYTMNEVNEMFDMHLVQKHEQEENNQKTLYNNINSRIIKLEKSLASKDERIKALEYELATLKIKKIQDSLSELNIFTSDNDKWIETSKYFEHPRLRVYIQNVDLPLKYYEDVMTGTIYVFYISPDSDVLLDKLLLVVNENVNEFDRILIADEDFSLIRVSELDVALKDSDLVNSLIKGRKYYEDLICEIIY